MIRWMLWGRQYGKTYQVIKWFLEDPEHRVIVTSNAVLAEDTRRQLQDKYPHDPSRARTRAKAEAWRELLESSVLPYNDDTARRLRDGRKVEVAVDNLELILYRMFGGNEVRLVTATGASERPAGLRVDPRWAGALKLTGELEQ